MRNPKTKKKNTKPKKLRIGKGVRTRDEFFLEQDKKNIHPEIPKDKLYRRVTILEYDKEGNLAVVKLHNLKHKKSTKVPQDKQKRKYEQKILTIDNKNKKIKITPKKFELSEPFDDVTIKQAQMMLKDCIKKSDKNKKRIKIFREKE